MDASIDPEYRAMSRPPVVWKGTQTDALALEQCLGRNCTCVIAASGARVSTCAGHEMLLEDQRTIDRLLFFRTLAKQLLQEEFSER